MADLIDVPIAMVNGRFVVTKDDTKPFLMMSDKGRLELKLVDPPVGELPIAQVICGSESSYFLTTQGTCYSCGYNAVGQLGHITTYNSGSNTVMNLAIIPDLPKIKKISSFLQSFFLSEDGDVYSCGGNLYGELGRISPAGSNSKINLGKIPGLPKIKEIHAGDETSFFIAENGDAYCCGRNSWGALGRITPDGSASQINMGIIPLSNVQKISSQNQSTLILTSDKVYSCGLGTYGVLGRNISSNSGSNTKSNLGEIDYLSGVSDISEGKEYSLFLAQGKVYSCGRNVYGNLGRTTTSGSTWEALQATDYIDSESQQIKPLPEIIQVSAGYFCSLFLGANGVVFSSGFNSYGQLGRISSEVDEVYNVLNSSNITQLPGKITQVGTAKIPINKPHSLFITEDAQVYSCGFNNYGQLGRVAPNGSRSNVNMGETIVS